MKIKNTKIKKEQGITLIALVVTIVVLLILAGITITYVLSDGGILQKSRKAANKTNNAIENEQSQLNDVESLISNMENSDYKGKTLVQMYDLGELKIGDYVDYPNPTTGSCIASQEVTGMDRAKSSLNIGDESIKNLGDQIFSVTNNNLNWRVLGKDTKTGGIKLIAGSPMKRTEENPYLYLYGAKSYINEGAILNEIASLYKTKYSIDARSVNLADLNEIMKIKTEEDIKRVDLTEDYGNSYTYSNQYTPESYLENPSRKVTVEDTITGYAYTVNEQDEEKSLTVDQVIYEMLFANTEYQTGKAYWLPCHGISQDQSKNTLYFSHGVVWNIGGQVQVNIATGNMFDSNTGTEWVGGLAVRPVIVLNPNVTEEQIPKIENKLEETWSY